MSAVALSVVVPCFDLEHYVGECLESLAPLGRSGAELIVVDDCSADGSADVIRAWVAHYNGRCSTIFHAANRGAPAAFNSGLAAASEPFICFVDADDIVDSDALARQAHLLAAGPETVVVVYGDLDRIDENGATVDGRAVDWVRSMHGPHIGDVRSALVGSGSVCPLLGTVMRTDHVRRVGGFDESLHFCDWPLWLKLAPLGDFIFSGETVGRYRQHPRSMSRERQTDLDHDRLRLLGDAARSAEYRTHHAEIAGRMGRLVQRMAQRGDRPPLGTGLRTAMALRSPRAGFQVLRAWLAKSPISGATPVE